MDTHTQTKIQTLIYNFNTRTLLLSHSFVTLGITCFLFCKLPDIEPVIDIRLEMDIVTDFPHLALV
jgi:hypothetical protein